MAAISKNLGLIQGISAGPVAPTNTFMLWVDNGSTPSIHKAYNDITSLWEPLQKESQTRPPAHAVFDDSGNSLPATTATLIDGVTIVDKSRVLVNDSATAIEVDKIYVAAVTAGNIVWSIEQDGTGNDDPAAGHTLFILEGTIYGENYTVFNGTQWLYSSFHQQNTDLGTDSQFFDIERLGTGIRLKNVAGELQLRDLGDLAFADFRVGNLTVEGTQTIVNSEVVEIADNILTLNSNVTSGTPTEDAGVHIRRGSETNASILWNESLDKWTAGLSGSEKPILFADQSNLLSNNTDFVNGDFGLELKTTEFILAHNAVNDIKKVGVTATNAFIQADNGTNISEITIDTANGIILSDGIILLRQNRR